MLSTMVEILYEDESVLVVDKPAGLASQPGERVGRTVLSEISDRFGFSPYPVHRLDKDTAGCMMLARSSEAAARWSSLLASRSVKKRYIAVCSGKPRAKRGVFDDPLPSGGMRVSATTRYELLATFGAGWEGGTFSIVGLELGSGRTHQIRRHLALHALPVLADDKYGDFGLNKVLSKQKGVKTLMLWARTLILPSGIVVRSALPRHFAAFFSLWPELMPLSALEEKFESFCADGGLGDAETRFGDGG